jgi:glycosyltransferase involved in cell wall biosynthesis
MDMGKVLPPANPLAPPTESKSSISRPEIRRQILKVGAVCGSSARTDLRGEGLRKYCVSPSTATIEKNQTLARLSEKFNQPDRFLASYEEWICWVESLNSLHHHVVYRTQASDELAANTVNYGMRPYRGRLGIRVDGVSVLGKNKTLKSTVSVLIPVFNGVSYLQEALESLWCQSMETFEVIVFDNGSTDDTPQLLERIKNSTRAKGRLAIVRNEQNEGIAKCMNEGIRRARGTWIARMDADDLCRPKRFEEQLAYFKAYPEISLCGTWANFFGPQGSHIHKPLTTPEHLRCMFVFQNPFVHSSIMWRRENLINKDLWYDERLDAAQDADLWFRCVNQLATANLESVLIDYRVHEKNVSTTRKALSQSVMAGLVQDALARLEIQTEDLDFEMHMQLGQCTGFDSTLDLEQAGEWLLRLCERNRDTGTYSERAFEESAAWCWYRTCLRSAPLGFASLNTWRRYSKTLPKPPHTPGQFLMFATILKKMTRNLHSFFL